MSALFEIQTPTWKPAPDLLRWALHYARLGWRIVPTHYATPTGCSCKKGSKCPESDKGKHPALVRWQKYATASPREVERWWTGRFRGYNIGLLTGPESGVIVLDVDDEEGAYLVAERGISPGPVSLTGRANGQGRHYFLQHPGYAIPTKTKPFPGVDIRGDGGFVVLPPSLHWTGNYYKWEVSP